MIKAPAYQKTIDAWRYIKEKLKVLYRGINISEEDKVFSRIFFSDIKNQLPLLKIAFAEDFSEDSQCSLVQQNPLPSSRLAVWAYYIQGEHKIEKAGQNCLYKANGIKHLWSCNIFYQSNDMREATLGMFQNYKKTLAEHGGTVLENAMRTWLFVPHIDINYPDVVEARKQFFDENGLTQDTHYISSTGIEGVHYVKQRQQVFMDAYAAFGLKKDQIKFLQAPEHLCPTNHYGVTFERGTSITYGDRKHVFISGTASIDNQGKICFPYSVTKQTVRAIENMAALLSDADCTLSDLQSLVVYIRDNSDTEIVMNIIERNFPNTPYIILLAPVCRPGWLVELEGMAVKSAKTSWPIF